MRSSAVSGSTVADDGPSSRSRSRAGPGDISASTELIDSVTGVPAPSARATGEASGRVSRRTRVYSSSSARRAGSTCQLPMSRTWPSRSTTVTMQLSVSTGTTSRASRASADSVSRAMASSARTSASSAACSTARCAVFSAQRRSVTSSR